MLEEVEWGDFKLGDLFEIKSTLSFNKDKLTAGNDYDYVTRTSQNQGILQPTGFVNKENINPAGIWSLGLLQMDFFYRHKPWYAGQFVRKVIPKIEFSKNSALWMTATLNNQKNALLSVLVRNVDEKFKNIFVSLPTKNGKIDFDFMERFIAELEAERIAELEAYLSATGLKNYQLTPEEQQVLDNFENLEWEEYKLETLFEKIKTKKLPFKANELPRQKLGKYTLPCLTSSFNNQGLNYFVPKDGATILKNVISIPSNSDIYRAYFQSNEFTVLSDAYALRWIFDDVDLSPNQYLFAVQSINKVTDLPIYSYKNKLGGWNVVKHKYIQLPVKNEHLDYKTMEVLISALKKLAIKDVVQYADQKIAAHEQVIKAS
ncbi:MAG: type I restriction endonuclease subunit R [Gammaproteobacteria bacterium]|nr:type I restriction endonuclease subunit R [Gammaproteobacteria bacterium]